MDNHGHVYMYLVSALTVCSWWRELDNMDSTGGRGEGKGHLTGGRDAAGTRRHHQTTASANDVYTMYMYM
jgi:hypothetical protein